MATIIVPALVCSTMSMPSKIPRNWFPQIDDVMTFPVPPENLFLLLLRCFRNSRRHTYTLTRAQTHSHTPGGTYTRTHTLTPSAVGAGRRARKNCSFFLFFSKVVCTSSAADGGSCGHFRGHLPETSSSEQPAYCDPLGTFLTFFSLFPKLDEGRGRWGRSNFFLLSSKAPRETSRNPRYSNHFRFPPKLPIFPVNFPQ